MHACRSCPTGVSNVGRLCPEHIELQRKRWEDIGQHLLRISESVLIDVRVCRVD